MKVDKDVIVLIYFLIILQNYTTVSKFIRFDNQPLCVTSTAVDHGGCRSNHCSSRRLGQRPRAPTSVKVSRRGPRRLRLIRCALRQQVQPQWATAVGVVQLPWPTAAGRLTHIRAENYPENVIKI
jgi:hypothetical protein